MIVLEHPARAICMESRIVRILKAIVMSAIMYGSAHVLGGDAHTCLALSTIPCVLGITHIATDIAYSLPALCLISACVISALPPERVQKIHAVISSGFALLPGTSP